MSNIPHVLLVAKEHFLRAKLCALADQCKPPVQLRTAVDCLEAQSAITAAAPDILFIAVAEEVLGATEQDNLDFATYIHHQEVGDVGALLEWVRHQPRPMKVGLFYPGPLSMVPPLILRLMGCGYVFAEHELRGSFAKIIRGFLKANTTTDRLTNSIFLSYARSDAQYIAPLRERLKRLQLNTWVDTKNLYPGEDWSALIERAIKEADFFLPFLSRESIRKRGVFQQEIRLALETAKQKLPDDIYLIPVLLEDCGQEILHDGLNSHHRVNMFEKEGLTRLLQTIVQGVYRLIPRGVGEEILIVDENESLRRQCEFTLREHGYHPIAYDVSSRVQDAFQHGPCPVVILDLTDEKGQQILQAVQPWSLTTKVIGTTRPGAPSIAHILPQVFRCLPKSPQFLREIRLYVHEALKTRRPHR